MILTKDQSSSFLDKSGHYDCRLIKQRFGYRLFGSNVSPFGDVVVFRSPLTIGSLSCPDAINITMQLPRVDPFGGVCFARLYAAQLGSYASMLVPEPVGCSDGILFYGDHQVSLTITTHSKDTALVMLTIFLEDSAQVMKLPLPSEHIDLFMERADNCFQPLVQSIFAESQGGDL